MPKSIDLNAALVSQLSTLRAHLAQARELIELYKARIPALTSEAEYWKARYQDCERRRAKASALVTKYRKWANMPGDTALDDD